jgi:hypothetical protein
MNLLLGAHNKFALRQKVIASEALHRKVYRAKQSTHQIATVARQSGTPGNDPLWVFEANYFILPFL